MDTNFEANCNLAADEMNQFVKDLVAEGGERSAVVLGAARLDVALESALKAVMVHHPGGSDNLFESDRPLGSFSAKIALAYRLGVIDKDCEHLLQLVRKVRNDFAHAVTKCSLSESVHRSRIAQMTRTAQKSPMYQNVFGHFKLILDPAFAEFCATLGVLLFAIQFVVFNAKPFDSNYVAMLAYESK